MTDHDNIRQNRIWEERRSWELEADRTLYASVWGPHQTKNFLRWKQALTRLRRIRAYEAEARS